MAIFRKFNIGHSPFQIKLPLDEVDDVCSILYDSICAAAQMTRK